MNELKAVIFDMNGTVLSDEGLYTESFKKVLSDRGIDDDFSLTKGISLYNNWQLLSQKFGIKNEKIEDLVFVTQEEYKKMSDKIVIRSGFDTLSQELSSAGIKKALATSNEKDITDFVLHKFDLRRHFDIVVTANDVNEVKPNPEIFLLAADLLHEKALNCIVFEDAQAGINAAISGGFKAIGIKSERSLTGADSIIQDFTEVSVESLQKLMLE